MKSKGGRPKIYTGGIQQRAVGLTDEQVAFFLRAGNGSLHEGVRAFADQAVQLPRPLSPKAKRLPGYLT